MQLNLCSFKTRPLLARAGAETAGKIEGHFALYNTLSEPIWDMYKWEFAQGSFASTVAEHGDQFLLYDHNWASVFGSRESGTAEFRADDQGLWASADPPDAQWAKDIMASVKRGDIKAGSIGFIIEMSHWRMADNWDIEVIDKVRLFEASVVTVPRFSATNGLIKLLPAGQPREKVASLGRALNRAVHELEWITEEDRALLKEHAGFFDGRVPETVKEKLAKFNVAGAPVVVPAVAPLETWQAIAKALANPPA